MSILEKNGSELSAVPPGLEGVVPDYDGVVPGYALRARRLEKEDAGLSGVVAD
jgi:hypothetical protein